MKKVLVIIPNLRCGGAEKMSLLYAKLLFKQGYVVRLVNLGKRSGELSEYVPINIEYITLGATHVRSTIFKLYKMIRAWKPDFIFSSLKYTSVLILVLSLFCNMCVILREPTLPSNKLFVTFKARIVDWFTRMLYKRAYKIIAQTDEMKQEIESYYKLPANRICVLNNPIDSDLLEEKTKDMVNPYGEYKGFDILLAVGNISYAKGYDILLEAFEQYDNVKSHLFIIGRCDGEYGKKIIQMVDSFKSKDRIHFLGFVNNPYPYMKFCTVYILSSRMEGLPNVLLEAMFFNKPIIASDCVPYVGKVLTDYSQSIVVKSNSVSELLKGLYNVHNRNIENYTACQNDYDLKYIFS